MIIDLHNHTSAFSPCSMITVDQLLEKYIRHNVEGICITEHNSIWKPKEIAELQQRYKGKISIFFGMEVDTEIGHVLVFSTKLIGIEEELPISLSRLERLFPRSCSAFIWAHPLRWMEWEDEMESRIPYFDAIELYNGNMSKERIKMTQCKFERFTDRFTGGSDTHSTSMAARYATQFDSTISSTEELIVALKKKKKEFHPIILS